MKNALCLVLALVLSFSLFACAVPSQPNPTDAPVETAPTPGPVDTDTFPTPPPAPSGEGSGSGQEDLLRRYQRICACLENYAKGESARIYDFSTDEEYWGQPALRYCYEQLSATEAFDSLPNTGLPSRQTLLSNFGISKDKLLQEDYVRTDNLGNVFKDMYNYWQYDKQGRLCYVYQAQRYLDWKLKFGTPSGCAEFFYDETGRLTKFRFKDPYEDIINAIITPTYNEQGQKTSETYKDNYEEWTYTFTYSPDGTLSREEWSRQEIKYWNTYTYDNGLLTQLVHCDCNERKDTPSSVDTTVYTYDDKGHLASAVKTCTYFGEIADVYHYTYVCDAQGRVIEKTVTPQRENSTEKTVYTYTYGDYYAYIPEA